MLTIKNTRTKLKGSTKVNPWSARRALFSNNEPGFLTPISPSVCFTDTAGTTQAQVGQAVALALDSSRGLKLGPELVTNGTFDVDANWTKGAGWTISGGQANYAGTGAAAGLNQIVVGGLVAGRTYEVSGFLTHTSGSVIPRLTGGTTVTGPGISTTGPFKVLLTAVSGNTDIQFFGSATAVLSIDNISIRELPGVHWTQPTLANRPILGRKPKGGRRNLLTFTEEFDNDAWGKGAVAVTANAGVAPDGTATADLLVEAAATAGKSIFRLGVAPLGANYVRRLYAKAATRNRVVLAASSQAGVPAFNYVVVDLRDGSIVSTAGPAVCSVDDVGSGWYRITLGSLLSGITSDRFVVGPMLDSQTNPVSYTGDGTSGVLIWGAQLELGSTATDYQRVGTAFDVTEAGKADCHYLFCGGSADPRWMQTPTITPGTDKAQVFAGVRKLSDAASGAIGTLGLTSDTGSLAALAPSANGANSYRFFTRGGLASSAGTGVFAAAPHSAVFSGTADISAPQIRLRVNGALVETSASSMGVGGYGNRAFTIGAEGATQTFFNGEIYALGVRFGPNLPTATIEKVEQYVASLVAEDTI
jgi:hypothetical protein